MGVALLVVQATERVIATVLRLVFPADQQVTLKELRSHDKATLGGLMTILKQRVEIDADLQSRMDTFLRLRNDLVHDVCRVPGFRLDDDAGLASAEDFLVRLIQASSYVNDVMVVAIREWQRQTDFIVDSGETEPYLAEVERRHGGRAMQHFLAHKAPTTTTTRKKPGV